MPKSRTIFLAESTWYPLPQNFTGFPSSCGALRVERPHLSVTSSPVTPRPVRCYTPKCAQRVALRFRGSLVATLRSVNGRGTYHAIKHLQAAQRGWHQRCAVVHLRHPSRSKTRDGHARAQSLRRDGGGAAERLQAETVCSRPRRCTAAPGGRRRTPRVSRIRRTAENDRSVSSATWRSESPAWY